jgi:hypothetical protein
MNLKAREKLSNTSFQDSKKLYYNGKHHNETEFDPFVRLFLNSDHGSILQI